jgi:hypothetical protein
MRPGRPLRRAALVLALALPAGDAAGDAAGDPPPGLAIYLLAGQSNMSGRGRVEDLPPGFPAHGVRIWNLTNADAWAPAAEPLDATEGQVDRVSRDRRPGVGPGLAFADAVAEARPGLGVGLVPCARGGASMAEWRPAPGRDTLYGSCLRRARLAARRGRIAGVLWYQGESDAASAAEAEAWGRRFAELVAAWRRDLGEPRLPVAFAVLGAISPARRAEPGFAEWDRVKAAQRAVRIPGVAAVEAEAVELSRDGLHLSAAGALALGRRLADAMLALSPDGGDGYPPRPVGLPSAQSRP